MKCIQLTSSKKVLRVNDEYADYLIEKGIGVFASKEKWKADGRSYLTKEDKFVLDRVRKKEK